MTQLFKSGVEISKIWTGSCAAQQSSFHGSLKMQSCCVANARDTTSHTVFVSSKVRSLGGAPHWEVRVGDIGSARLPEEVKQRNRAQFVLERTGSAQDTAAQVVAFCQAETVTGQNDHASPLGMAHRA